MADPLKLLHVEDSESDAELIVRHLRQAGYDVSGQRVDDAESMRAALADPCWDLIICDYQLPGFSAPDALAILRETGRDIPFLVVSGTIGEDVAVAMMKAGAHDYLMKGRLARLGAAVDRELRDAAAREERRQALNRLTESESQLALLIDSTETGVFDYDPRTGKVFYSALARRHLQIPDDTEPTIARFLDDLHPEDRPLVARAVEEAFFPGSGGRFEMEYRLKTPVAGERRWISTVGKAFHDSEGLPVRFLAVVRDVTANKRAEKELEYQLRLTACITEQSMDCILLADRDGRISFVNPETVRVFGFTLDEFRIASAHDLLHRHHPDGRPFPAAECRLAQAIGKREVLRDHEDVLFHRDGTPIDVAASAVPLELYGGYIGTVFTLRVITERKRAERALRQSDERFRRLCEAGIIGIVVSNGERILETNDHFLRMLGYTREEFFAARAEWRSITPDEFVEVSENAFRTLFATGDCQAFEKEYVGKGGVRVPVLFAAVELSRLPEFTFLCYVVDLTERKKLEKQFRQAQKLESIGQLASGVAHDFNNLLTVISGYSEMVVDQMDTQDPNRAAMNQVLAAGRRAAGLTRQLLMFSRQSAHDPKAVVLDALVLGVKGMLQRLIGAHIEVIYSAGAQDGCIYADPGLIEQVVVNLAVNARDAMPEGGKLLIETSRMTVSDDPSESGLSLPPGNYLSLGVTDTGTGMTAEVQSHLFEPFFTTKEQGKGTGLGLSTVHGIVTQCGGAIRVTSTVGAGTAFRVVFPALRDRRSEERPAETKVIARGTETVLVVEDDSGIREFVHEALEKNGYRVLAAATGREAIEVAARYAGPIHLLVTDMALPGMNRTELVRQFLASRRGVPVLLMSGLPQRFGAQTNEGLPYLQKPFTGSVLLNRVREILDTP